MWQKLENCVHQLLWFVESNFIPNSLILFTSFSRQYSYIKIRHARARKIVKFLSSKIRNEVIKAFLCWLFNIWINSLDLSILEQKFFFIIFGFITWYLRLGHIFSLNFHLNRRSCAKMFIELYQQSENFLTDT